MSDEGSGPVDGQEVKIDLVPHHQKHPAKEGGGFVKTLLTGGVIIGGIVGLYMLWKHLFGKKDNEKEKASDGDGDGDGGKRLRIRKRGLDTTALEEGVAAVYAEALANEEFLEFLEKFVDAENFEVEVFGGG